MEGNGVKGKVMLTIPVHTCSCSIRLLIEEKRVLVQDAHVEAALALLSELIDAGSAG
jgi:hypothetical protein